VKGLPTDLIFIVLLGAALLFNLVMQRAARRRQAEAAQNQPAPDEIPEEVWRGESATAEPPPATRAAAPRRAAAPTASPLRTRRRFARQSLLKTKRQVQDAFVVATILGRCRGDEPHEIR